MSTISAARIKHFENFEDPDLDEEIVTGLEGIKRQLQNWGAENDLLFNNIDPTLLSDSCDFPSKRRSRAMAICRGGLGTQFI
jgi:hypothetical protein